MKEYIGDSTSFLMRGKLTPFVVEKNINGMLHIKSADLNFVAIVTTETWNRQKKILADIQREDA